MNSIHHDESQLKLTGQFAALVIDDDVWSLRLVKGMLTQCFPGLEVQARQKPNWKGNFDVFFIDNDFGGVEMAPELTRQIRAHNPEALIIAFSSRLDAGCLKELINAGCDGACDKSIPDDLSRAMEVTRRFLENVSSGPASAVTRPGLKGAIESIRGLLREWNTRLEREEQATLQAATEGGRHEHARLAG